LPHDLVEAVTAVVRASSSPAGIISTLPPCSSTRPTFKPAPCSACTARLTSFLRKLLGCEDIIPLNTRRLSPAAMRRSGIGVIFFLDKPAGLKRIPRQHPDLHKRTLDDSQPKFIAKSLPL